MGSVGGGNAVINMVQHALKVGYRHIDTALYYGNEQQVGEAVRNSGIPREELFITTKLPGHHHGSVQKGFEESLGNLDCQYIDLFLMHWPQGIDQDGKILQPEEYPTFVDTWKEMEKLLHTGKVKSIGVSNFSIKTLDVLLPQASVIPAVNQIEMHPLLPQTELLSYCKSKSILLTAYTPLAKHQDIFIDHPSVISVKNRLQCTTAQVLLSWGIIRGTVVIPKTANNQRLEENFVFVDLLPEENAGLDNIHRDPGMHRSVCGYHSPGGMCSGWTYEQLGWPMKENGIVW